MLNLSMECMFHAQKHKADTQFLFIRICTIAIKDISLGKFANLFIPRKIVETSNYGKTKMSSVF